jgi:hypothetical protein
MIDNDCEVDSFSGEAGSPSAIGDRCAILAAGSARCNHVLELARDNRPDGNFAKVAGASRAESDTALIEANFPFHLP